MGGVAAVPTRLAPGEPGVEAGRALAAGAPARGRRAQLDHAERTARQRLPAVGTAHHLVKVGGGGRGSEMGLPEKKYSVRTKFICKVRYTDKHKEKRIACKVDSTYL